MLFFFLPFSPHTAASPCVGLFALRFTSCVLPLCSSPHTALHFVTLVWGYLHSVSLRAFCPSVSRPTLRSTSLRLCGVICTPFHSVRFAPLFLAPHCAPLRYACVGLLALRFTPCVLPLCSSPHTALHFVTLVWGYLHSVSLRASCPSGAAQGIFLFNLRSF